VFELRFEYRFEAAHRFTKTASVACMTPHGHSWYAGLTLQSIAPLNTHEMVVEFGTIKKHWKQFLQEVADHSFFHHAEDPILKSLWEHVPEFRSLPFPGDPTTELIAACFLRKAFAMGVGKTLSLMEQSLRLQKLEDQFEVGVEIVETPTNLVALRPKSLSDLQKLVPSLGQFEGWWDDPSLEARWIRRVNQREVVRPLSACVEAPV
jgi:6-pyruvoyl-tetrahydropterin synthase